MISFDEALEIVMKSAFTTENETIAFVDSAGRILAEDIVSNIDMPPFNRSAVDGYACRKSDMMNLLDVVEVIAAGKEPLKKIGKDQCSKIMTGAIVPEGSDIVFMVEEAQSPASGQIRYTGTVPRLNISYKGEDIRNGDVVLKKGKFIEPQDISVMATVGQTSVVVKKKPVIGIISTGDELVEPSETPRISQIRNSNAYQLLSQVARAGGKGRYYGIAPDIEDVTLKMIERAVDENDIVLITGGVSMGDFDFVPSVLKEAGVRILFDKVNVQPGKPTTFGVHSKAIIFGLPGNPVSSFVQFETLIRPLINKMMDYQWDPISYKLPMAVRFERKSTVRMGWIPVKINENKEVVPVEYHGSAHISSLSYSTGLIVLQPGMKSLEKGDLVNVRQV
jgi:molybdopterin molybdotransferase